MTGIHIRPATSAECGAVETLVQAAYQIYIARIGKPPGPMLDDYAARIASGHLNVAESREGGIVGIIVLVPQAEHLLLDNIAVHPAAQGRGIGRRLIAFAQDAARRLGYCELRLYTHAKMTENIAFYARLGFEETGRGAQDGYDRVFMRQRLSR